MIIHIVSNFQLINEFKKSKYFKNNLGYVSTVEKNGKRTPNEKDKFSYHYMGIYKSSIYAQGNVGNMKFYTDHYINEPVFGVYYGEQLEEFIFDFDFEFIKKKGIDAYLGKTLKELEEKYEERVKNKELKKTEEKPKGNAETIIKNPGSVTYADLKEYLKKKKQEKEM